MSEDFKPGTRTLLRLAGLDIDQSFVSREDESISLWRAVVVLLMRLHLEPDPESRRNSGRPDAQIVHSLRAALAENFGAEAGGHIAWALIHYGCRQKPTMASLHEWERLMFEWQQRRASAPRIALMLRDAGLPESLGPRALDAVDRWISDPPAALGAAPEIIQTLFGRRIVSFTTADENEAALVDLFGELVASAVTPGTLGAPRLRSQTDESGTRWIIEYTFQGMAQLLEAPAQGNRMRLDGMMDAVDDLLTQIGRPERVFRIAPGRAALNEPAIFIVADGAKFAELVRRLRIPTLRLPKEAGAVSIPAAPPPSAPVRVPPEPARRSAPSEPDTAPASTLGPPDSSPASMLNTVIDTEPSALQAALPTQADDVEAPGPGSVPPFGAPSSGLEAESMSTPSAPTAADPAMRALLASQRRSFGAGRLLQGNRWVRLAHVSPPVKIQTNAADPMRVLYAKQELLLRKGRIVWGALVPIDQFLATPGTEDLPALLVYSREAYFDDRPAELSAIAIRLAALRGAPESSGELRRIGQQVRNDSGRPLDFPLPPQMTTQPVMLTSFMAIRSHLPDTVL
ncbi:MAG: hypothetical protein ABW032_11435, partial [Burkholderiaceae bacterium]